MITIATQVEGIRTRKDNTCAITFGTQELTPSQAGDLFHLNGKFCYVAIKPDQFKKQELEVIEALEAEYDDITKRPHVRFRNTLYVLFTKDNEGFNSFTAYYEHHMERLITHFKNKIDA